METRRRKTKKGESVEKVWTIYNPLEFVSMSQVQKRDLLRASGVRSLPRPREGAAALDEVLTDLMDEAVRSEYIRLTTDTENASKVDSRSLKNRLRAADVRADGQSRGDDRVSLLRRIGEALDDDDMEIAVKLRQEFAYKTALRADPTQAQGSYDPYLDQDAWYQEQRRRAMAPRKKE